MIAQASERCKALLARVARVETLAQLHQHGLDAFASYVDQPTELVCQLYDKLAAAALEHGPTTLRSARPRKDARADKGKRGSGIGTCAISDQPRFAFAGPLARGLTPPSGCRGGGTGALER